MRAKQPCNDAEEDIEEEGEEEEERGGMDGEMGRAPEGREAVLAEVAAYLEENPTKRATGASATARSTRGSRREQQRKGAKELGGVRR